MFFREKNGSLDFFFQKNEYEEKKVAFVGSSDSGSLVYDRGSVLATTYGKRFGNYLVL